MNRKGISAVCGVVFLVAVFAGIAVVQSKSTPSVFKNYNDLTNFATNLGFYTMYTTGGKHNPGSVHSAGLAADIRTWDHTPEEVEELMKAGKAAGLRVIDERCKPKNPKVVWGGQHVHVEISKKASKSEKNLCTESTSTPAENIEATKNVYLTCRANFSKCTTACKSCFTSCSNKESTCISSNLKKIKTKPTPKPEPKPEPILPPEPTPAPVQADHSYSLAINVTASEHTECDANCVGRVDDSSVTTTIALNNLLIPSGFLSADGDTSAPFRFSCSTTASGGLSESLSDTLGGYSFGVNLLDAPDNGIVLHYRGGPNYTYFQATCKGNTQDPTGLVKKALEKVFGGDGQLWKHVYNINGETVPFSGSDHDAAISNDVSHFDWSGTVTITKVQ